MAVHSPIDKTEALLELKEKLGDALLLDEEVRREFDTDFGRVVRQMPGAVARCASAEEVAEIVRFCRDHGIVVVARGQGHTQTGQSTTDGGVVIDTASMQRIHEISHEGNYADCDGGLVWRELVAATVPLGLVPRVLTNNLGVSLAGTISVAGLGVASYRYGTQADNVIELEVVTGTGEIVVCSRQENTDLFNAVRCGFGQFGIITRAKVMLRRCKEKVRMYHLLYDDLETFMEDASFVMEPENHDRFHTLESRCAPCPIFTQRIGEGLTLGEGMQLYAHWMYPMFLTVEYNEGEDPDDAAILDGLKYYKHLRDEEYTQLEFCNRLVPIFDLWHRSGNWEMHHPWVETTLTWDVAKELIPTVLSGFPPQALGPGGHILLWPARNDNSDVPLFMYPESESKNLMGFGILPAVPTQFLDQALSQLEMFHELTVAYGGKRYLSGWISFKTVEEWENHFGSELWGTIKEAKKRFDPDGILNPGFFMLDA
ncbi:MAG: FAD-binding protein [Acidobacteriota bacterium]